MIYTDQVVNSLIDDITFRVRTNHRLGLFMSGGFDSTTLAWIVFNTIASKRLDSVLTLWIVPRYDDSVNHVHRVLDVLPDNVSYTIQLVGDPDLHHSRQVWSGIQAAKQIDSIQLICISDTKNPDVLSNGPSRPRNIPINEYHPFLNYYKTITLQIAQQHGILDTIALATHTCTESSTIRCGKCWQCQERAWAFNQLNLIDNGKM